MTKKTKIKVGPDDLVVNLYDGDRLPGEDFTPNVRYGRWREDEDGRYLVPGRLSGSDYSGSLVERSNYRSFAEGFKDGEGEWWTDAPGGHGTFAVVIDTESVPEDVEEEVAGFLNGLHDYALADEDAHSEMEMEAQQEAWDNWARHDFQTAVESKFEIDLSDADLTDIFETARERANEYWVNEQGDSMYIDLKRIVAKVTKEDVKEFIEKE